LNFLTVAAEAFGYSLSVDEGAYIFSWLMHNGLEDLRQH